MDYGLDVYTLRFMDIREGGRGLGRVWQLVYSMMNIGLRYVSEQCSHLLP